MSKRNMAPRTFTIKQTETYHITFNREDGFGAFVGGELLGYFPVEHLAQGTIDEYFYQTLARAA